MPKFQIFLSSTFEDLKEVRRVAMEQILNLGHIPVGMELFQAGNDSQWDYIKRRIVECDYYLLIVGDRYGSCLPDGMSYTELEYTFAVEQEIPVASFLMSREALAKLPRTHIELDPEKAGRLEDFRSLAKQRMVKYWSESYELAARISSALPELIRQYPRPGLVSPNSLPPSKDSLRRVTLRHGSKYERQEPVNLYDALHDELSDASLEAQGLKFFNGEDFVGHVEFNSLIEGTRVVSWQIDEIFKLLFEERHHFFDRFGAEESIFSGILVRDWARKYDVDLVELCQQNGAEWCELWSHGERGLFDFLRKLDRAGLMRGEKIAPGRDHVVVTLAGRLLLSTLERLPEVVEDA